MDAKQPSLWPHIEGPIPKGPATPTKRSAIMSTAAEYFIVSGYLIFPLFTKYYTLRRGSTRFSRTAFKATIIDDADISRAAISGLSDQPKEV